MKDVMNKNTHTHARIHRRTSKIARQQRIKKCKRTDQNGMEKNKQAKARRASKKNAKRNPEMSWNKTKQGIRRETEWIRTVTTTEHWATQTHYGWLDRFVESGRQYTSSSKLVLGSHPSVSMYFNIAIVFVFASQSWNEIPTTALQTVEDWKIIASTQHTQWKERMADEWDDKAKCKKTKSEWTHCIWALRYNSQEFAP